MFILLYRDALKERGFSFDSLFKEAYSRMKRGKLDRNQSYGGALVHTLITALEAREFITGHSERLQEMVAFLGKFLNLPAATITNLRLLAQFHDIGKVGVPDHILFKPGPLTVDEALEMQRHCEIGYHIALSAPRLVPIADWILKHHEWWNGKGYPLGLKGEEIPIECRILAIADAYDAMTNDRPYRRAIPPEAARAEIKRCAGVQFDPELVDKFLKILDEYER